MLPDGDLVNVFDLITSRRGAPSRGAFYNVAILRSEDQGLTWGPIARNGKIQPIIVSPLLTSFITDPETGDYVGLASDGIDFLPFFSQTHDADPGSIFFRRVGP